MKPIVSVVVPVYNAKPYLRKCLDSVIGQSFTEFEAILVNDGSLDCSGEICDEYAGKDERFIVIHQKNQGVSAARNLLIEQAKGQYLTFLDSDDWVASDWLEVLYNGYSDEVGLVGCNLVYQTDNTYCIKNSSEKPPAYWELYGTEMILRFLFKHPETMAETFHHGSIGRAFVWNKMYRMDVVQKYKVRFNETIKIGEDYDFNYHYMSNISVARYTPYSSYYYYQNNASAMAFSRNKGTYDKKMINYAILFDDIYEAERQKRPEISKCCEAISIRLYNRCLAGMVKSGELDELFVKRAVRFNRKHIWCSRKYDADSSWHHFLSSVLLLGGFQFWKFIIMKIW